MALAGLGLGTSYALVTGDGGAMLRLALPAMTFAPAVLVLSGLARLLYGVVPRAAPLAWAALLLAWVVLLFGDVFDLPQWLQDLSPFEHLALVPLQDFSVAPFAAVSVVAALLSVVGQFAFLRRDVH